MRKKMTVLRKMLNFMEITRNRSLIKPRDTKETNTAPVLTWSYFSSLKQNKKKRFQRDKQPFRYPREVHNKTSSHWGNVIVDFYFRS